DYEPLEPILSIEEALVREDVKVHDSSKRGNVFKEVHLSFGDLEAGFAKADHTRDDWFFFEGNTHAPIESHSCVANGEPNGNLTLWTCTQVPHYLHRELDKVLGVPRARIRVCASYGIATTYYTGALLTVTYRIPTYKFDGVRVYTNKPPCGPKRGHGTTQPRFAFEAQLDKIATDLGLDPLAYRQRILQPANSRTVNDLRITSMGLGECLAQAGKRTDFSAKH